LRVLNVFLIKEQIPLVTLTQLKQIIAHQKLVAFELVKSVASTRPSGAWVLILQAINTLRGRGSGHARLIFNTMPT